MPTEKSNKAAIFWTGCGLVAAIGVLLGDQLFSLSTVARPASFMACLPVLLIGACVSQFSLRFTSRLLVGSILAIGSACLGATMVDLTLPGGDFALGLTGLACFLGFAATFVIPVSASESGSAASEIQVQQVSEESVVTTELQPFIAQISPADECNEEIIQTWTRLRLGDGAQRIEGQLHVEFSDGERIKHIHIPVFPAFAAVPEVWCESEDDSVRLECTMRQTYGIRLTARRSVADDLSEFSVEASVVLACEAVQKSAA